MALTLKTQQKKEFPVPAQGTHVARLIWVLDMGLQESKFGIKQRVHFTWELPEELLEDGQPMVCSCETNVSLHEKAKLPQLILGMDPSIDLSKELNIKDMLGLGCQVQITHTPSSKGDRVWASVERTMPLAKGQQVKPVHNDLISFDFDNPSPEVFHELPKFLQDRISRAKNFAGSMVLNVGDSSHPQHNDDEDLPF